MAGEIGTDEPCGNCPNLSISRGDDRDDPFDIETPSVANRSVNICVEFCQGWGSVNTPMRDPSSVLTLIVQ